MASEIAKKYARRATTITIELEQQGEDWDTKDSAVADLIDSAIAEDRRERGKELRKALDRIAAESRPIPTLSRTPERTAFLLIQIHGIATAALAAAEGGE